MSKFFVIGEDERQAKLRQMYGMDISEDVQDAKFVILPTPLTKDGINVTNGEAIDKVIPKLKHKTVFAGKIPRNIEREFEINNIKYYDLLKEDGLAIKNAIPTAEGVIFKLLELRDKTIFDSKILILGFGKCGKILADRLNALKAKVYVEARQSKDISQIEALGYNSVKLYALENVLPDMDVIINTVPYMLLNKRRLELINSNTLIIDIASSPGGTDFDYCKKAGIKAYLELGIPAKIAPESAARYIKHTIDSIVENEL